MAIVAGGREYYKEAQLVTSTGSSGVVSIPAKNFKALLIQHFGSGGTIGTFRDASGSTLMLTGFLGDKTSELIPLAVGGSEDIFVDINVSTSGTCKIYMLF